MTYQNNRNKEMNPEVEMLSKEKDGLLILQSLNNNLPFSDDEQLKYICYLESKQASLQLKNEELLLAMEDADKIAAEKYDELYQFAPIGFITFSKVGEITELNHYASLILGIECSLARNISFDSFVSVDTKSLFNLFLGRVFSNNTREVCEITLLRDGDTATFIQVTGIARSNGEQCLVSVIDITDRKRAEEAKIEADRRFWVLFENGPMGVAYHEMIYDDSGEPIDYQFLDAKRKRAEEALKESELKFRTVADQTIDWVYWMGEDQQIVYMSPACKNITGYDPEEFISNPQLLKEIVHPSDAEVLFHHLNQVFLDEHRNKSYDLEMRIICKEGALVWISHICRPIFDENGQYLGRRICNRDITEKKRMMVDLIKAKEQAEESDRLKSSFLANMSHEIRTPMNGIMGFAELLKENNLSGEERQEYIQIIRKSGTRMLNIINDIMSISKVESGQMEVYISETNINKQINYLYTFFKPEAEQKGLQLLFKMPLSDKEAILQTDKEKIYSIITNLVKNAIKFTLAGSIEFGYERKDRYLEFFVKDTGPGIREEQKNFIFERFRQGSESLSRNYEGAGLGLTISKAFVEMLGGEIWVESSEGKGSAFYFTIPYIVKTEKRNLIKNLVSSEKLINLSNKLKILIAEDDQISSVLLGKVLRNFSKELLMVKNGIEAVEACSTNPDIDLILMDIKMPLMDGYEATRLIRRFNTNVIIIAQSSYALKSDHQKAIAAGCNDYISKPINKERLNEIIIEHFENY